MSYLIINSEVLPLAGLDSPHRGPAAGDISVDPAPADVVPGQPPKERETTRGRRAAIDAEERDPSERAVARPGGTRRPTARPPSLLQPEAMDAELARLKATSKVRRKQLKQLRKAGALLGDVLARGFLTAYLLHLCDEQPRHGNGILSEIESRTEGLWVPSSGGVYTMLRKLEKRELLEGTWEAGATRDRRVYRITDQGRAALDEFRELAPPRIAAASRVLELVGTDLLSKGGRMAGA